MFSGKQHNDNDEFGRHKNCGWTVMNDLCGSKYCKRLITKFADNLICGISLLQVVLAVVLMLCMGYVGATQDVVLSTANRLLSTSAYDDGTAFNAGKPFFLPGNKVMRDDAFENTIIDINNINNPQDGDTFGINSILPDGSSVSNLIRYHSSANWWCSPPIRVVCYYLGSSATWALGTKVRGAIGGDGALLNPPDGTWTVQLMSNGTPVGSYTFTVVGYTVAVHSGTGQTIGLNSVTPAPLIVKMTYPDGVPATNKNVTFTIASYPKGSKTGGVTGTQSPGNSSTYSTTTDYQGFAKAYLTSGSRAGIFTVTASSSLSKDTANFTVGVSGSDPADAIDGDKSAGLPLESGTSDCGGAPESATWAMTANPINIGTGNKFRAERDYQGIGPFPLEFTRYYNSVGGHDGSFGPHWRSSYDRTIQSVSVSGKGNKTTTLAEAFRPDGKILTFTLANGAWVADPDVTDRLETLPDGRYKYTCSADHVELYSAAGQLQSISSREGFTQTLSYDPQGRIATVADAFGRVLTFTYDGTNRLTQMIDPAGQSYSYSYDGIGNLASVQAPGAPYPRQYQYRDIRYPSALTDIVDENFVHHASFSYDESGRAGTSQLAGGADYARITYFADGSRWLTDGLGTQRKLAFSVLNGVPRRISLNDGLCDSCGATAQLTSYGTNGFVTSVTDNKGVTTSYVRNSRGLETSRTEASGTAQARTITTTWHATFRLPLSMTEPGRTTSFSYDAQGRMLSRAETDTATNATRTTSYTYNAQGLVASVNGPRADVSDVTSFTYDVQGNLATVTDALGRTIRYTAYDAHGRPLSTTDPNGLVTGFTYDPRGHLTSRSTGGLTTTFAYDGVGQLTRVTQPDGSWLDYQYDQAHRLIGFADNLGNATQLTLDMNGKVTERRVSGAGGLAAKRNWAYDQLGRVTEEIDSASHIQAQHAYDPNGNRTQSTDAVGNVTRYGYDALNRLSTQTDALSGVTTYAYDARNNLTQVADPRNVATGYTYNGLNDRTQEASPDGGTSGFTFDSAGNLKTRTWGNGKSVTYTYDALNRVTQADYGGGITMSYQYDSTAGGNYGIGHRTQMTDPSGSTAWTYDQWGRVIQKTQTTGSRTLTTAYAYDAFGRLASQTYPSGRQITYGYTNGQLTSLSLDGQPLISQILWQPFGPPAIWSRPDGTSMVRSFDLDNQLIAHTFGAGTRSLGYDANGRVSTIQEPGRSISLSYDALDRLVSETLPTGNTGAYTYDSNGNRTSQSGNATSSTYGYQSGTNRLLSISGALTRSYSYDGAGNIVADGQHSYGFDASNRLSAIDGGQTQYRYNGLGQRVQKTGGGVSYLAWDEAGQVIGEYDGATTVQETVYLGNLPVAMIKAGVAYSIDTDQIGAPRVIRNLAGQEVWRWDTDAFGAAAANANPSGAGAFAYNPRFPGQFYDAESGKHYNGFRDYDPVTGRYVQSDPLGLQGGINTYTYVGGNPLSFVDPSGLICMYSQSTGVMTCTDSVGQTYYNETGYAGTGPGRNNPSAQGQQNVGPIPQGLWEVTGPWYNSPNTGRNTIRLTPLPGNQCGRTGRDCTTFRIHGNNSRNDASHGCIVLPPNRTIIPTGETIQVTP